MKLTSTIRALQLMITGLILLAVHFATAQAVSNSKEIIVRPCTRDEFKVSTKPEFRADNHDTYIKCEALEIHWLPGVHILRFHSPVHTDYVVSVSVIKIGNQPMQFIQFLSGPMAGGEPNKLENIRILNKLLNQVDEKTQQYRLIEFAQLFMFVSGSDRNFLFQLDQKHHGSIFELIPTSFQVTSNGRIITANTIQLDEWRLIFGRRHGHWNFDGFNERVKLPEDELTIVEKHPYPNQLPGYELYEKYISPLVLGKSSMKDAVNELGIDSSIAHDGWYITPFTTCKDDYKSCELRSLAEETMNMLELVPAKTISFSNIKFSDQFDLSGASVSEINISFDVYRDDYGLEYWLHASDSKYGKKGDLYQIVYKAIEK